MFTGTFTDIADIASKNYDQKAKHELEKQLNFYAREYTKETIIELGLPQVLMFLSSTIAKSNNHKIINSEDVEIAFAFLRYLLSSDIIEDLIENNHINIGLPLSTDLPGRLIKLLKIKGDMRTKTNLDGKISRLISFLSEQKLNQKHINRIEIELRATILLLSRLISNSKNRNDFKVLNEQIDLSYDLIRYLIFKLDSINLRILRELYIIDDEKIWRKIPKMIFDQSAHDHLSSTAYAEWESNLPQNFESLKKHINCSPRPFLTAILGFSEIYGAKKDVTRVSSHEMLYILEDFEKYIFGNLNPLILEKSAKDITFTKEGLTLLGKISKWIQKIIINRFGKDEYVFNFNSTVTRHMSLLLFIAIIEQARDKVEKIDVKQVANAIFKWSEQLKILKTLQGPI
ncbi:MAG: hypothetical protein ACFFDW_09275 [Candidatus Thorarchaeota archaeon]